MRVIDTRALYRSRDVNYYLRNNWLIITRGEIRDFFFQFILYLVAHSLYGAMSI
jgi:hypothetical protein